MDKKILAWKASCLAVESALTAQKDAEEAAELAPLPKNLRAATAGDIIKGQIIWYPEWTEDNWTEVQGILNPHADYKAYTGKEGCRYGLSGAFIDTEE